MFTGLIEATGTVTAFTGSRLTVTTPLAARLRKGDSIAVNGVCLTALDIQSNKFSADLAAETIARTTLAHLAPASLVNLELPTPAGTPLGGHIVQGHVDGVGTLLALDPLGTDRSNTDWRLRLRIPGELVRYVAAQGSITVNGTSLTVAAIQNDVVEIAILPHTRAATNLHTLTAGSPLNIEVDMLAKYAEKQFIERHKNTGITLDEFIAKGY
ncbi:MAG TPA: riboflavin synthase [Acidobacteriaceae bacterium]|nr:riboflavin synthase [Acidobacteriaceae bacterium]